MPVLASHHCTKTFATAQVADFDFWKRHRSSARYWRHVTGIFDSRTASWLSGPLSYVMLLTTGVCLYYTLAEVGAWDGW